MKKKNIRGIAANLLSIVLEKKKSLDTVLSINSLKKENDQSLLQEICFGVIRVLPQLQFIIKKLMYRPIIDNKNKIINYLIMVGLYQIQYMRIPNYAVLSETVNGVLWCNRSSFKGLVNAVLRKFILNHENFSLSESMYDYYHPSWMIKTFKKDWPKNWKSIVKNNNLKPPFWIRVNRQYFTRKEWLKLSNLKKNIILSRTVNDAILIKPPISKKKLFGFERGFVSIQDVSSQYCAILLDPKNYENILDVCAAPGMKTSHILEIAPKVNILSIDINKKRIIEFKKNMDRLSLNIIIQQGDGRKPKEWYKSKKKFDRIILDAPCSATGIIRRHPDIKWLRLSTDIKKFVVLQRDLLNGIWPLLKKEGILLYSTCSVLKEENQNQITHFLKNNKNAKEIYLSTDNKSIGLQMFPTNEGGDGFFYAKIKKIY
ncbi:16S rRNA (cytosine(967)-C(5))-methyltransferase RsmB [Candidatus Tachikawaea gelatinosa]|nr:16S rRNA (cytosine(967)-C(5))-methyltransferase RsmB [Candidatus Tachikawaea gelatinosa]